MIKMSSTAMLQYWGEFNKASARSVKLMHLRYILLFKDHVRSTQNTIGPLPFYSVLLLMSSDALWSKNWISELDLASVPSDTDCKLANRRWLVIYEAVEHLCVKINFLWDQFVKWRVIASSCHHSMLG